MGWPSTNIRWKLDAVRLWNRLIETDNERLVKKVFLWDISMNEAKNKNNFSAHIKQICCTTGLKTCFTSRTKISLEHVKKSLTDKMSTDWMESIQNMRKLDVFRCIKRKFGVEKYLELNLGKYEKSLLSQLRYGVLPLRVETGRFVNESYEKRICTLCDSKSVEDSLHFIFHCSAYDQIRTELNSRGKLEIPNWENLCDTAKLCVLFDKLPRCLARYVKHAFIKRRQTLYK